MVVLLIIAILMAIAIPTFLGARSTANARSAQSNLSNGLIAEQTYWTNNQSFGAPAAMVAIEPNLSWVTVLPSSSSAGNAVLATVSASPGSVVALQAYAKDGNCYIIEQDNTAGVTGTTTGYAKTSGACAAIAPASPLTVVSGSASASTSTDGTLYTSF